MFPQHERAEHHYSPQLSPKIVENNVQDMRRQLWPVSNNSSNKAVCSVIPFQKQGQLKVHSEITTMSLNSKIVGTLQFFLLAYHFGGDCVTTKYCPLF